VALQVEAFDGRARCGEVACTKESPDASLRIRYLRPRRPVVGLSPFIVARRPGRRRLKEGSMPRFYFHIKHGADLFKDEEGVNLESITLAHAQALQSVRELLADAIKAGRDPEIDAVVIADERAGLKNLNGTISGVSA
jgi:hypothetical protein